MYKNTSSHLVTEDWQKKRFGNGEGKSINAYEKMLEKFSIKK